ncbi:MAG: FUSC family membrane protein [Ferruginibacter sp.]
MALTDQNTYKNFFSGRFFSEGLRMTVGILVPALVFNFFGKLEVGILLSLGALCSSIADIPGPVHLRRNGMLVNVFIVGIVSVIMSFSGYHPVVQGAIIFVLGFVFSMFSVYGARVSSIGISGLIIMVLSLDSSTGDSEKIIQALLIVAGALWYMFFSLMLYILRPYRLMQQTLGDFIVHIGGYFKTRGEFYKPQPDFTAIYNHLLEQQIKIQEEQQLLSDIIFSTRQFTKESTAISRNLVKIYTDTVDLFESIMTSYQDYALLQKHFEQTGILSKFGDQIQSISAELELMGIAVKSGTTSHATINLVENIGNLVQEFEMLRKNFMQPGNVDDFFALGRILNNLKHISQKTHELHFYTRLDTKIKKRTEDLNHINFSSPIDISARYFFDNIHLGSNIFRHSLRVAIALLVGYIVSSLFDIGHSYWILLTIVVILKPAYSLTKQRNKDRLIGTFAGIIIGLLILFFVENTIALFSIMVLCMLISYSFLRIRYLVSVITLTPYLILFFYFLYPAHLKELMVDRMLDTAIGSVIAFLLSLMLLPQWEHENIAGYMKDLVKSAKNYYGPVASYFTLQTVTPPNQEMKLARKQMLTALSNVSGSFNRMLSEPRRFQKGIKEFHQFVVFGYLLTSHLATLSYFMRLSKTLFRSPDLLPVKNSTERNFSAALTMLEGKTENPKEEREEPFEAINEILNRLLKKRREEISLGNLESETKNLLVQTKSVTDQFTHIYELSKDITRQSRKIMH